MKKIFVPPKQVYAEKGLVICNPSFVDAVAPCTIGYNMACAIVVRKNQFPAKHSGIDVVSCGIGSKAVLIQCNRHYAKLVLPNQIDTRCSIDLEVWKTEPILSILPVISAAMLLWQRAFAKGDLTTDDIWVDSQSFDGILPIVVAAAVRGTPVRSYRLPESGIQKSVCENLAVEMLVPEEKET